MTTSQQDLPTLGLRELGKQRRVDQILDAARELLRDSSDQPLTVERIAVRAQVSAPTVFNLVGTRDKIWAALADDALGQLDLRALRTVADPQVRARAIIGAVITMICADAPVFRALLANWIDSARLVDHDPTGELLACLEQVATNQPTAYAPKRLAELISAGLIGLVHQWGAGLMSDRALAARGRDVVDIAFLAITSPPV